MYRLSITCIYIILFLSPCVISNNINLPSLSCEGKFTENISFEERLIKVENEVIKLNQDIRNIIMETQKAINKKNLLKSTSNIKHNEKNSN
jgi:hypothetical protein